MAAFGGLDQPESHDRRESITPSDPAGVHTACRRTGPDLQVLTNSSLQDSNITSLAYLALLIMMDNQDRYLDSARQSL